MDFWEWFKTHILNEVKTRFHEKELKIQELQEQLTNGREEAIGFAEFLGKEDWHYYKENVWENGNDDKEIISVLYDHDYLQSKERKANEQA